MLAQEKALEERKAAEETRKAQTGKENAHSMVLQATNDISASNKQRKAAQAAKEFANSRAAATRVQRDTVRSELRQVQEQLQQQLHDSVRLQEANAEAAAADAQIASLQQDCDRLQVAPEACIEAQKQLEASTMEVATQRKMAKTAHVDLDKMREQLQSMPAVHAKSSKSQEAKLLAEQQMQKTRHDQQVAALQAQIQKLETQAPSEQEGFAMHRQGQPGLQLLSEMQPIAQVPGQSGLHFRHNFAVCCLALRDHVYQRIFDGPAFGAL